MDQWSIVVIANTLYFDSSRAIKIKNSLKSSDNSLMRKFA